MTTMPPPRLLALRRRTTDQGATAIEYALMASLVAVVVAVAVGLLGRSVVGLFLIPAGTF